MIMTIEQTTTASIDSQSVKVIDPDGYYAEQFLCRQVAEMPNRKREEILDNIFLAVNLITDLAPRKLDSVLLDASTEASAVVPQLFMRGFSKVLAVPETERARDKMIAESKAEGWALEVGRGSQKDLPDLDLGPHAGAVDLALFMDSSFGQYSSRKAQLGALQRVSSVLGKDGVLLLDLSNPIERIRNVSPPRWTESEHAWTLSKETIDPFTLEYRSTIITVPKQGGAAKEHAESGALITLPALREVLSDAGLAIHKVYGSYDREPLTAESTRMIVVAGKRA